MLDTLDMYPLGGAFLVVLASAIVLSPAAVHEQSQRRLVLRCLGLLGLCAATALTGAFVWFAQGSAFALAIAAAAAVAGTGAVLTALRLAVSARPPILAIAAVAAVTFVATLTAPPELAMAVRVSALCGVCVAVIITTSHTNGVGGRGIGWVRMGAALFAAYAIVRLSVGLVWGLEGVEASGVFSLAGSMTVLAGTATLATIGLIMIAARLDDSTAGPRLSHTMRHLYLRAAASLQNGSHLLAYTSVVPDFAVIRAAHGIDHAALVSRALIEATLRNTPSEAFSTTPAQGVIVTLVPLACENGARDAELRELQIMRDFASLTPMIGVAEFPAVRIEGREIAERAGLDTWVRGLRRAVRAQHRGAFASSPAG